MPRPRGPRAALANHATVRILRLDPDSARYQRVLDRFAAKYDSNINAEDETFCVPK